jgi:hypothetical protein
MNTELYRNEYEGEFVVTGVRYKDGKKEQEREWVDNPLQIKTISGRAVCVSNGPSIDDFYLQGLMKRHGLLNTLALHVYATGNLYKQVKANFHVTFNKADLEDLIAQNLTENIIVYTNTSNCLKYPGEFFIIPYGIKSTQEAIAAWLACFDGHSEVYLLGYDQYTHDATRRQKMIDSVADVIKTYNSVKFFHVIKDGETPNEWRQYPNIKTVTRNYFISRCDIS